MNDIDTIRRDVFLPGVAQSFGVDLDRNGNEYEACCPFHEERSPSFTIFQGSKDSVWRFHCFGCGASGDAIDFVEKLQGVSTGEAIKILNGDRRVGANIQPVQMQARDPYAGIVLLEPPTKLASGRNLVLYNPKRERNGNIFPTEVYPYIRAGHIIGYVLRHEFADGTKETPMVCWTRLPDGEECWSRFPFPKPRPLYGAERITEKTTQVIVVEGEKKVDAIWRTTGRVAVSAAGGTNGGRHTDWSPLAGKKVLIWPDADPAGFTYLAELAEILAGIAGELKFIDVLRSYFDEGTEIEGRGGAAAGGGPLGAAGGRGSSVDDQRGPGSAADGAGGRRAARGGSGIGKPGRAFDPTKGGELSHDDWRGGAAVPKGWDVADAARDGWGKPEIDGFMVFCRSAELPQWPTPVAEPAQALPAPVGAVGADAVRNIPRPADLEHGSEVHIAQVFAAALEHVCGPVVHADGGFWAWGPTCWREIPANGLRLAVHKYDAVTVQGKSPIKIGRTTINGVISEIGTILSDVAFFNSPSMALNAADMVIEIEKGSGAIITRPHSPDDRFRFTIPARYGNGRDEGLPEGSMLHRLVTGAFKGDPDAGEKIDLIGEILGAAAFGIATRLPQPKAFVFLGETASNGKSTIASLLECLLPEGAVSHIPPSAYEDERRIVNLAGKAANVADELSANAIAGETFKAAITGNALEGRDLYRSAVTFVPRAIHVFTTNTLPRFHGGLDRGLQRRLVVVRFNRPIPEDEIIEDIADRIRNEELDLLLRFAIEGARRLFARKAYTIPGSSSEALQTWLRLDPLVEWFEENMAPARGEPIGGWKKTSDLFKHFKAWAIEQGHSEKFLPPVNTFSQRLRVMPGVVLKKRAAGMYATGVILSEGGAGGDPLQERGDW